MTTKQSELEIEIKVLTHLADAWNAFQNLCLSTSDNHEMISSIHRAQDIIAHRQAKRAYPEIWK